MYHNFDKKFHKAAASKDVKTLKKIINQYDKYIADQLIKNKWSLSKILRLGKPNLTKLVLDSADNTFNVNQVNRHGFGSALHEAAYVNDVDHVKLLLDHNADPNIMEESNRTPLNLLYRPVPNYESGSDEVLKILLARGAKAVTIRNGRRYLQIGSTLSTGSLEAVESVLKMDVDLRARYDDNGETVLHDLAQNHNWNVVSKIIDGDFGDVNSRKNTGETALWGAAFMGKSYGVEVLLGKGADPNIPNENNVTPLFIATEMIYEIDCGDYMECIELLLEYGADIQLVSNDDPNLPTVFDVIVKRREHYEEGMLELGKVMLEHLALQKANGTEITELIRSKLDSDVLFKKYLDFCKELLARKVYESKTLLDLLCCNDEKLIPLTRNVGIVKIVKNFIDALKSQTVSYGKCLQKRLDKASRTAKLRDSAAVVICKLMKIEYNGYSSIVDSILFYLKDQDLEMLLNVLS